MAQSQNTWSETNILLVITRPEGKLKQMNLANVISFLQQNYHN
ncbi:hypothetical protein Aazo_0162 ['Nostoc azollae' 0708]|jgi:hypothetical protein|uniref:Uncharacterized protein n=1 Tax=Nostoc azollae (strain 0708) TaxID=551115 RepID=D7DYH4_NOSA0|nr:hypothetical protein Aazo_0162 ['Nostoc azollae' 0708]